MASGSLPPPGALPPPPTDLITTSTSSSSSSGMTTQVTKNNSPDSSEFEFVNPKDGSNNQQQQSAPILDVSQVSSTDKKQQQVVIEKEPTREEDIGAAKKILDGLAEANDDDDEGPGLFDWMKGASGGLLNKVAEKTKFSVETMITTLDPQMKDYIHSGGDIAVVVASDKEAKYVPVRDAFQKIFGKATVVGLASPSSVSVADQPVGFAAGRQGAMERIQLLRSKSLVKPSTVVVSIEGFLLEVGDQSWVEMSCLILSDPENKINLTCHSQPTPVDAAFVEKAKQETPDNYPKRWSGLSSTIGSVISKEWNVPHQEWHSHVCGVSRSEMLQLAASSLAGLYKRALALRVQKS